MSIRTVTPIRFFFYLWLLSAPVFQGCTFDRAQKAFERGEKRLSEGEYGKAIEEYSYVAADFQESPYAPKSLYKITFIYNHHLGDVKGAREAYSRLIVMFPDSPEALEARQDMAAMYSGAGEHRRAIEEYQRLMEDLPEARAKYQYMIAMEYVMMNEFRQARVELVELLDVINNPNLSPVIRYEIANTYYIGGNMDEAIKRYDEIIARFPEHKIIVEVRFAKARALNEEGRLSDALAILKSLDGQYPNAEALKKHIELIEGKLYKERRKGDS